MTPAERAAAVARARAANLSLLNRLDPSGTRGIAQRARATIAAIDAVTPSPARTIRTRSGPGQTTTRLTKASVADLTPRQIAQLREVGARLQRGEITAAAAKQVIYKVAGYTNPGIGVRRIRKERA